MPPQSEPSTDVSVPARPGGFCRDCLTALSTTARRCAKCGSPRLLWHKELFGLSMAHIDCDAFYATVEKRDDPSLRDKPLIIGGGKRGVVSTACYIARINGVRSAMPMFKALKACPDAVVLKPNMEKYVSVGKEVREMMLSLTPLVQPISIDEAFLDLAGTEQLHKAPAAITLAKLAKRIQDEIGITVSVGLSHNKFLAKVASDLNKPRGFSVIGREETVEFMAEKPVSIIWGVGKAFQAKLAADGITTVADLQRVESTVLAKRYGVMGLRLADLAFGRDARTVKPRIAAKSVSAETTFNDDKMTREQLAPVLRYLCEKVSRRLKAKEIAGHTVILKLKTKEFKSRTRNRRLPDPTQLADRMFQVGHELLLNELDGQTQFRLMGIGVSDLRPADTADPFDLVDQENQKRARIERAMDKVRDKFGVAAVETGLTYGTRKPQPADSENNDDMDH